MVNGIEWAGFRNGPGTVKHCPTQNGISFEKPDGEHHQWAGRSSEHLVQVAAWMGGGLGESEHMYMYNWAPLLFAWNCRSMVNQL